MLSQGIGIILDPSRFGMFEVPSLPYLFITHCMTTLERKLKP